MKKLSKIMVFLTVSVFLGNGAAHANKTSNPSLREIVVFGESSWDLGNVFKEQCPPNSDWGPWAPCSTSVYWRGRASNGPVWVEFLADSLRVPRPKPSLCERIMIRTDGAKTGNELNARISLIYGTPVPVPGTDPDPDSEVPGVLAQIEMSKTKYPKGFNDKQLVVIWGGANDLRDIKGQQDLVEVVTNIATAVATTACRGAKQIIVTNLPDASIAPAITLQNNFELVVQVKAATLAYNDALKNAVTLLRNNPSMTCGYEPQNLFR